jgi:hypothetical protein
MCALLGTCYLSLTKKLSIGQLKFSVNSVIKLLCSTTPIYWWFSAHNSFNP